MAELDRMFEDDSTESFENLESRLKTPAKKKKPEPVFAKPPEPVSVPSDALDPPSTFVGSSSKAADSARSLVSEDGDHKQHEADTTTTVPQTPSNQNYSLYEVEIDDRNFEDVNNASLILRRARSYEQIATEEDVETTSEVVLASSNSEEDLRSSP